MLSKLGGQDNQLDSYFLLESYKYKRNLVTDIQELVPKKATNFTTKV